MAVSETIKVPKYLVVKRTEENSAKVSSFLIVEAVTRSHVEEIKKTAASLMSVSYTHLYRRYFLRLTRTNTLARGLYYRVDMNKILKIHTM